MSAHPVRTRLARVPPDVRIMLAVVAVEAFVLVGYFGATPARAIQLRYALYPFVWMNVGLWGVLRTRRVAAARRRRLLAAGVAAGYFVGLAYLSGLIALYLGHAGHGHSHASVQGLQVTLSAPGWGPRVGYAAESFHVYFVPYRVVGYLTLSYLLYARLAAVDTTALSGILGVATCVGCSFPAFAALFGGIAGVGSVVGISPDLSTAAFVLAAALLSWPWTRSRRDRPSGGG
jgi:hypothetical protein